jgi:Domain of unknown function (DUF1877)
MGAVAKFQRIPSKTLSALRKKPSVIFDFLTPENRFVEVDGKLYTTPAYLLAAVQSLPTERRRLRALRWQRKQGLITLAEPSLRRSAVSEKPRAGALDIGKEWHGLHFLLCGTARKVSSPLGTAILGGRPFGPNLGYGRARFLEPVRVAQVSKALAGCRVMDLRRRFDPQAMTRQRVYPTGAWRNLDDSDDRRLALRALLGAFTAVRSYYRKAAAAEQAMLLWLT